MTFDHQICIGCGLCVEECFLHALRLEDGKAAYGKEKRCISCGHCAARCPAGAITAAEGTTEVEAYEKEAFAVEPERLLRFMKSRRSTRAFQPGPVDRADLKRMLEAARYAGTGGNRQPLRYLVLEQTLPELLHLAAETLEKLAAESCRRGEPDFYSGTYHMIYRESLEGRDALFHGARQVILVVGDGERGVSVQADGYLATAYLQLMGEALGIGSCVNCFFLDAVRGSPEIRRLLGLGRMETVVSSMAVGYPTARYLRTAARQRADLTWK